MAFVRVKDASFEVLKRYFRGELALIKVVGLYFIKQFTRMELALELLEIVDELICFAEFEEIIRLYYGFFTLFFVYKCC